MPNKLSDDPASPADVDPTEDTPPPLTWLQDGLAISQRVMVVAMSLGLPVLLGAGVDLGWPMAKKVPIGMLTGFVFGMLAAGWQLLRLTQWLSARNLAQRGSGAGSHRRET